jgi:hypothetical protein
MSSPLAIAGVTRVLQDLLNDGLVNHDVSGMVGGHVSVRALPPDRLLGASAPTDPTLNLFLYRVNTNTGWANVGLPERAADGSRFDSRPLGLNLHYLLSAFGVDDLHDEILLGYAMQILHDHPVILRSEIGKALTPSPVLAATLPPALRALAATELDQQIEQVKITRDDLATEEMSRIWTATQASYRPSTAYQVSVVLLQSRRAGRQASPVLTLGKDNVGVAVEPNLLGALPTLESLKPPALQSSVRLAGKIELSGHHLDGAPVTAVFDNAHLVAPIVVAPDAGATANLVVISIPNAPASWLAGAFTVRLEVQKAGEPAPRQTNDLPLQIAPLLVLPPAAMVRNPNQSVSVTLGVRPNVRPGQVVSLSIGGHEQPLVPIAAATGTLKFVFPTLAPGVHPIRLRVDGVDSWLTDRDRPPIGPDFKPRPPIFDPTQTVMAPP